jgi:hypothetical protein
MINEFTHIIGEKNRYSYLPFTTVPFDFVHFEC